MSATARLQFSRQWRGCLPLPLVFCSLCPSRRTAAKQHRAVILLSGTQAIYDWTPETKHSDANKRRSTLEIWLVLLCCNHIPYRLRVNNCCSAPVHSNMQKASVRILACRARALWIRAIAGSSKWESLLVQMRHSITRWGLTYICASSHASSSQPATSLRHSRVHSPPSGGSWAWWRWFASKSTRTLWKWCGTPAGKQLKVEKHKQFTTIIAHQCFFIFQ